VITRSPSGRVKQDVVAASLPPPYGLNLAVPWDVVITDTKSGERLFAANMPGPVDPEGNAVGRSTDPDAIQLDH